MAEISINEYVRTIDGYIRKIDNINIDKKQITYRGKYILDIPYKNSQSIAKDKILKHSKNIIDLIEEGDYVNGEKIGQIENGFLWYGWSAEIDDYSTFFKEKDIETVVTKEQFASMEYKVKE